MENQIALQPNLTPPQKHLHPGIWIMVLIVFVAAIGYLIWASQSKEWPFAELPPTPSLTKEGEKGEFQGWQTYRNEEYGFEFKYPMSWDIVIIEGLEFFIPQKHKASCGDPNSNPKCTYLTVMYNVSDKFRASIKFDRLPNRIIGNVEFILWEEEKTHIINYFVQKPDGKYLAFYYRSGNDENSQSFRFVVEQILSTFRFTE